MQPVLFQLPPPCLLGLILRYGQQYARFWQRTLTWPISTLFLSSLAPSSSTLSNAPLTRISRFTRQSLSIPECSSSWIVQSLIKAILDGVSDVPLKFFILSRPEDWIKQAFDHVSRESLLREFTLHNVAKSDVQRDIDTYLRSALSEISMARGYVHHDPSWPPEHELKALLIRSDGLFIYAATAIRYIGAQGVNSRRRPNEIVWPGPTSVLSCTTLSA